MFRKVQFYQRMLLIVVAWSGLIAAPQAFAAYKQISIGQFHACGIKGDGSVVCWGLNRYGQTTPPSGTFNQLSTGVAWHTCGIKSDGSAVCWGLNEYGQATPPAGTFIQISVGYWHSCGVKTDGSIVCWGGGKTVGTGKTTEGVSFEWGQAASPSGTFSQVSVGPYASCGIKSDGGVVCWGRNHFDQATPPSGIFRQISTGYWHVCGLKSDAKIVCWGWNGYGQTTSPDGIFSQVVAGSYHSCGLTSNGRVTCWGSGTTEAIRPPPDYFDYTQGIPPAEVFSQISVGSYSSCGIKSDSSAVCWGAGKTNTGNSPEFGQSMVPADNNSCPDTNGSTQTGINQCKANPASCSLFTQVQVDAAKQAGIDLCKTNPSSCNLFTQAQIDAAKQASITQCKTTPASCGITLIDSNGSTQAGIDQCKANPASCGITKLDGISTNAFITPANKMIAGVLISGGTKRLMVRASSVDGAVDPLLEIVTYPDRKPLGSNDSWATDPAAAELTQKKLAPARATDAAVIINLPPGLFTMEITSKNGASGAGIIEVYDMAVFP